MWADGVLSKCRLLVCDIISFALNATLLLSFLICDFQANMLLRNTDGRVQTLTSRNLRRRTRNVCGHAVLYLSLPDIKNKWAAGIFDDRRKARFPKVATLEPGDLFKHYDLHKD